MSLDDAPQIGGFMGMTHSEMYDAISIITLMRQGNKPRQELIDREEKKRIDEKWYRYQLKKINEGNLILSTPPNYGLTQRT